MENILDNTLLEEQSEIIIYGGFWPRFWALLIDGLIFIPVTGLIYYNAIEWKSIALMALLSALPVFYKPFWEFKFGTTIGKKALSLWVVNLDFKKANLQEVILRNIFHLGFGVLNIIFSIGVYSLEGFLEIDSFMEIKDINNLSTGLYWVSFISGIIYLTEFIMLITDDRKRTLHDRIAQTYVIKREAN